MVIDFRLEVFSAWNHFLPQELLAFREKWFILLYVQDFFDFKISQAALMFFCFILRLRQTETHVLLDHVNV